MRPLAERRNFRRVSPARSAGAGLFEAQIVINLRQIVAEWRNCLASAEGFWLAGALWGAGRALRAALARWGAGALLRWGAIALGRWGALGRRGAGALERWGAVALGRLCTGLPQSLEPRTWLVVGD